jgi:acetyl-CoA C-acetyltransferase/acetyl-CoA acyltransferase
MAGTDSNPLSWEPLAVVAGARTPFAKSFGALSKVPADELGRLAVAAALDRAGLTAGQVDELVVGNVAGQADASNVARVIALRAGVPNDRIAHTVNRNCASGMEAVVAGWQAIRDGRSEVVVAGGTESMTNVPLLWDRRMAEMLLAAGRARGLWERARAFLRFRPGYLKPIPALKLGLTDPVCGLNMGQTAEVLAREFNIGREEQDRFALASHQKALAAWERCFLGDEVVAVPAEMTGGKAFERDNGPRAGQSLEQLAKLKPIFEPSGGTVTAGNSCKRRSERRTARLRPRVRRRGVRPAADGPRPGLRDPSAAQRNRPDAEGHRSHRDQRSLRRPGARVRPGDGLGEVRPRGTQGQRPSRRDRPRAAQR